MRFEIKYLYCILLLFLSACTGFFEKKTNWNVTLDKKDKKPYGAYLAYQSLKYFYPATNIIDLSPGFHYSSMDDKMLQLKNGKSLLIAVGLDFYLSQPELEKLLAFAKQGNEIIIFSRVLDEKIEDYFNCSIQENGYEEMSLTKDNNGLTNLNALTIVSSQKKFGYQGRSLLASFKISERDTSKKNIVPDTLGFIKTQPNIIKYAVGNGHIIFHAAPLVMSNYFLLQKDNRKYLEYLWKTLPDNVTRIYWNDYYKRSTKAANFSVLLKYPATKWALILAVFVLIMYLIFESKRKQRIIPIVVPLENSSVSFVETVGRLYYNKGNHTNLGEKMIQHFLEWVRTHYFINTSKLDAHFMQQLTLKSGLPQSVVTSMMELIREVLIEHKQIDETELYHLHQTIQQFYKNK